MSLLRVLFFIRTYVGMLITLFIAFLLLQKPGLSLAASSLQKCQSYFIQHDLLNSFTSEEVSYLKKAAATLVDLQNKPHTEVSAAKETLNLQVLDFAKKKKFVGHMLRQFFSYFSSLAHQSQRDENPKSAQLQLKIAEVALQRKVMKRREQKKLGLIQKYYPQARAENFESNLNLALQRSTYENSYNNNRVNIEDIQLLLEMGADKKKLNEYIDDPPGGSMTTPLDYACEHGSLYVVKILLDLGVKAKPKALVYASYGGHQEVVEYLLNHGADIEAPYRNTTPLIAAARNKRSALVEYFLNKGVEVNKLDDSQYSALTYAAQNMDVASVRLLLHFGADPNLNIKSEKIITPLSEAVKIESAQEKEQEEIVVMLLEAGANINTKHWLSLHIDHIDYAVRNEKLRLVEILLKYIEDKKETFRLLSTRSENVLRIAGNIGNLDIFRLLIEAGIDVNLKNNLLETPLIRAVNIGHKEMVEYIISQGADVDAQDIFGLTALTIASSSGNKDLVQLLIAAGANPRLKSKSKATALSSATENNHPEVVELLKTYLKETKPPTLLERIRSRWQNRGGR